MIREYELIIIIPATFSDQEIPAISEKVAGLITKEGGQIQLEDNLGRKKLTYPIKKNEVGTYLLYQFTGGGSLVGKIEKTIKMSPEIIRYLIITDPIKPEDIKPEKEEIAPVSQLIRKKADTTKSKKINLEDLEEKLDNILEDDILT
ncbi:30S ribosomal protein S6 [Patescibacteria group bacterium]|nr:30S ribosomal protein S6 [Patescibacteria group bacterium]